MILCFQNVYWGTITIVCFQVDRRILWNRTFMEKFSLVNFYLFSSMFVCSTFNDASLVVKGVLLIYLKWSPWQPGWKIFDYLCMVHHKPLKIHGQNLLPILYESYTHTPFSPGSPGLGNDFRNEILRFVNSAINCVQSGWIHFEQQRLQFKLTTPSHD